MIRTAPKRFVRLPKEFGLRACGLTGGIGGEWARISAEFRTDDEEVPTIFSSSLVGLTLGECEPATGKPYIMLLLLLLLPRTLMLLGDEGAPMIPGEGGGPVPGGPGICLGTIKGALVTLLVRIIAIESDSPK